jgi:catechol 2,3-dioxygenase-like lactoylglutathione lyase family enzyme
MTETPVAAQITFLYTRDLAATATFYEEVVGLPLKLDQGACRIYRVSEDGYLGFCQAEDAPGRAADGTAGGVRHVILTLVTEDVDGWYDRLRARGVAFEDPPTTNPKYQIYHCFFRDPNGYLVEIQRFLHPF